MDDEEIKNILWLSGLKNAVSFNGKPNRKAIMGKLMAQSKDLRLLVQKINPLLDEIIKKINELSLEEQKDTLLKLDPNALDKEKSEKEIKILPELPNLENYNKLVMRLAPYPSGALHIGNARMIVLNDQYIKKHNGELILFFDDTIGSPKSLRDTPKAKYVLPEAYDLIEDGLKWLGVKYSKIYYKSDRLEIYYEYCEKLIKDNIAYVCFCSASDFKEKFKNKKKDCPHRNASIEENLNEWKNMLDKKYRETEAVVRLKTGMDQKDPALRDQIIMRISEARHPRVGEKYVIWPMLEFSWAIDDHLIGVTHIIRGADLIKEDFIENFIWDHYKWKKAEFLHYGRIKFSDMKLSKTEARNKIQDGTYDSWDDPRTWSLQSLRKRGIKPEALKQTLLDLGMSMTGIKFSVTWLYSKNQEIIDEYSHRYFYVENPVKIIINKVPFKEKIAEPLILPNNPKKGNRKIRCTSENQQIEIFISETDSKRFSIDDLIRLKDLMNTRIKSINLSEKIIKAEFHSEELERSFPIIQWVPKLNYIKVSILKPDGIVYNGFGEINLKDIPLNKTIQFERYGFVNPIRNDENGLFCYFTH
ncbi:MAG: glutamate--tRNA ligase [Candidatus Lokiarchaeota archaeon]|nr:glutamate--tRNA ligase [Candidatus Lokiarchaeota archaeon]